jgi:hypothetical protein
VWRVRELTTEPERGRKKMNEKTATNLGTKARTKSLDSRTYMGPPQLFCGDEAIVTKATNGWIVKVAGEAYVFEQLEHTLACITGYFGGDGTAPNRTS